MVEFLILRRVFLTETCYNGQYTFILLRVFKCTLDVSNLNLFEIITLWVDLWKLDDNTETYLNILNCLQPVTFKGLIRVYEIDKIQMFLNAHSGSSQTNSIVLTF